MLGVWGLGLGYRAQGSGFQVLAGFREVGETGWGTLREVFCPQPLARRSSS